MKLGFGDYCDKASTSDNQQEVRASFQPDSKV